MKPTVVFPCSVGGCISNEQMDSQDLLADGVFIARAIRKTSFSYCSWITSATIIMVYFVGFDVYSRRQMDGSSGNYYSGSSSMYLGCSGSQTTLVGRRCLLVNLFGHLKLDNMNTIIDTWSPASHRLTVVPGTTHPSSCARQPLVRVIPS